MSGKLQHRLHRILDIADGLRPVDPMSKPDQSSQTLDRDEVDRFADMADEWWDPQGKFAPLHRLNPTRLDFIVREITKHFNRDRRQDKCLSGLKILDIGCGGGLVAEPLARLGGRVTGIDPAEPNIEAARRHSSRQGLEIDYRACRAEDIAAKAETFDVVTTLEVVEHVPDVPAFLKVCGRLVSPGGLMLLSTINRTLKAYALAIIGAEYVLGWLPRGTHQWDRFVTPEELRRAAGEAGLKVTETQGMVYNPLLDEWRLSNDLDVNYIAAAKYDL